jgi:hypothetical protein
VRRVCDQESARFFFGGAGGADELCHFIDPAASAAEEFQAKVRRVVDVPSLAAHLRQMVLLQRMGIICEEFWIHHPSNLVLSKPGNLP